jgi:type VI secretion system protein ImpJ
VNKKTEAPIPVAPRRTAPFGPAQEKKRSAGQVPAAIQWHDGLLLEPQHFQESARRFERLFDYHLAQLSPFHYGVVDCAIDAALLPGGVLRLNTLEAVMPDGLVVHHPFRADFEAAKAPELDLRAPAFDALFDKGPVTVHLAVMGEDAEAAAERGDVRYDTSAAAYAYDEIGRGKLEIPRLLPRIKLVVPEASGTRSPAEVTMPVCRLKRGTKNVYEEVAYEPPRLRVAGGSLLYNLCNGDIVKPLKDKALRLATTARALVESAPEEWQRKVNLKQQVHALCAGLPPVEALLEGGAHPHAVYLALAGLVGQVAAASQELIPPAPAASFPYRHEDLLASFTGVRDYIGAVRDAILESFDEYPLAYDSAKGRYQARMPPGWKDRHLALAVRALAGPRDDLRDLFARACLCAESFAKVNAERRATGAPRAKREEINDPTVKELLRDIVTPPGALVYWLDRFSPELAGEGPFVVFNLGDGETEFELKLYVSHDPVAAMRAPGAQAGG